MFLDKGNYRVEFMDSVVRHIEVEGCIQDTMGMPVFLVTTRGPVYYNFQNIRSLQKVDSNG
jgi:hypothetical protein